MGIISGSGSFRGRFGDHFRVGDHFGVGIISGAVQNPVQTYNYIDVPQVKKGNVRAMRASPKNTAKLC